MLLKSALLIALVAALAGPSAAQRVTANIPDGTDPRYNQDDFAFGPANYGQGMYCCQAFSLDPITGRAYLIGGTPIGWSLTVLDVTHSAILATLPLPVHAVSGIAVNTTVNKVYVGGDFVDGSGHGIAILDGNTNQFTLLPLPTSFVGASSIGALQATAIVVNPKTNKVYVPAVLAGAESYVLILDGTTNQLAAVPVPGVAVFSMYSAAINVNTNRFYVSAEINNTWGVLMMDLTTYQTSFAPVPANFSQPTALAINTVTGRVYVPGTLLTGNPEGLQYLLVLDANGNQVGFAPLPVAMSGAGCSTWECNTGIVVDSARNRLYFAGTYDSQSLGYLATVFCDTGAVSLFLPPMDAAFHPFGGVDVDPQSGRVFLMGSRDGTYIDGASLLQIDPESADTPSGSNVAVQADSLQLTFSSVSSAGTTSVTAIDPATAGQAPGGFSVSNTVAFEVSTTSTFSGPVTIAFKVPGPISLSDFNNLRVLHNQSGALVDVTAGSPAPNYATLTIFAQTTSFSPFYLTRLGHHILPLFDQTKANQSGSTIPVKVQLIDGNGNNLSSSALPLVVRGLKRIGDATSLTVQDSGNANPDATFRYDSGLKGYVFNLSTKGLSSGTYALSFFEGNDRSFLYTVTFQIR